MIIPTLTLVIPCHNEARAISKVIQEFRQTFPDCNIVVINNASDDETEVLAKKIGAQVINEPRKGKAQAMLKAFEEIQTDLIIMVDGDGSYPAEGAKLLLERWQNNPCDMLTGIRCSTGDGNVFRPMHQWGSNLFAWFVNVAFKQKTADVFSGLRLFSKRFYKNVPVLARGFELEMELTIQAIDKGFSREEINIPFRQREEGTVSKLKTVTDGFKILKNLVFLFRDYKPLVFFAIFSACFFIAGLVAGLPPICEYFQTRLVGRFPLAILAAALMNLSLFTLLTGMISQANLRYHREAFQIRLRNFPKS
ncbi:MAG: glycosyltransferase family 2 protein [Verrucomicrobiales bacterium]|jgi:glycosyltransferase involved in cell wall biosynthesis|nr:glycosyltransferase family 2 protein [Verrucomicrobiales bacterium]